MPANCSSDANVSEQQDEMEAISAIYSEQEIHIIRPAPISTAFPSACFSIVLTSLSADLQGIPLSWEGQISLTLDFPSDYPNGDSPLRPTIELGTLSMMDFPIAYKKSLQSAIVSVISLGEHSFSLGIIYWFYVASCHIMDNYVRSQILSNYTSYYASCFTNSFFVLCPTEHPHLR